MKNQIEINGIPADIQENKALAYFVKNVSLDASQLPKTVDHIHDNVLNILARFQKHLLEFSKQLEDLASKTSQFSDLITQIQFQLEKILKKIVVHQDAIVINGEDQIQANQHVLADLDGSYLELVTLFNELLPLEKCLKDELKKPPTPSINKVQKQILDAIATSWLNKILKTYSTSWDNLSNKLYLKAPLQSIFEVGVMRFEAGLNVYMTIKNIRNTFKHLNSGVLEPVMPTSYWLTLDPSDLERTLWGIESLSECNDKSTSPITKKDVAIYLSHFFKTKIAELEYLENTVIEEISASIKTNDYALFEKNRIILRNNKIPFESYFSVLSNTLVSAEQIRFLQINGIDFYRENKDGFSLVDNLLINYSSLENDNDKQKCNLYFSICLIPVQLNIILNM